MKKPRSILLLLLLPVAFSLGFLSHIQGDYFEISKNLEIFGHLFKEINKVYVDETSPTDLMRTHIDAVVGSLDPYTNFYSESQIDQSKLIYSGQYSGIGAEVGKRNDQIIILELTGEGPADMAGLRVGDQLLQIDNIDITGNKLNLEEINNLILGERGSEVRLKIQRSEGGLPLTISAERGGEEKVQETVSYYDMVNDSVGYILLENFTGSAGKEVGAAFKKLKEKHSLSGLILDLRANPGGRLDQAVDISNLFLPQGELVVEMRGRARESKNKFYTRMPPLDTEIPLVILVNGRSASASEIVAGSIQDLDRGVIVGRRSFGKGLVQNFRPLTQTPTGQTTTQMKVTIAKYYTPSGRCIQAIDYANRNADGSVGRIPDSLVNEFQTRAGRVVFDGGGVEPDILVEKPGSNPILRALQEQKLIFDFANQYASETDSIPVPREFEVNQQTFDDFVAFVLEKEFDFQTQTEDQLSQLALEINKSENQELIDELDQLRQTLQEKKMQDLTTYQHLITPYLKRAIISRFYFAEGVLEASFVDDQDILKAVDILGNADRYKKILHGTQ
ncbi:MAG: S41 family peptidase [Bacteroidota bacterium]